MILLALSTSGRAASAALLKDGAPLAEATRDEGLTHSETILPLTAELLAQNGKYTQAAKNFRSAAPLVLHQSFRTAYRAFEVIPQATTPVLVPFGNGEALIGELCSRHSLQEEIHLLRKAQSCSVALYDNMFRRLKEAGALYEVGKTGALALAPGYYDPLGGVQAEPQELKEIIF